MRFPTRLALTAAALLYAASAFAEAKGPLSPDERAQFEGAKCKPFVAAVQGAMQKVAAGGNVGNPDAALVAALADAKQSALKTGLSEAQWSTCLSYFQRDMQAYRQKSIETEAVMVLKMVGNGIKAHFAEAQTLCPSTKKPAPANVKAVQGGHYEFAKADWSDPAWSCAGYEPTDGKQRFQYELKTNDKAKTFEIVARGYPGSDDTLVTLFVTGKVVGDTIETSSTQRR